MIKLRELRLQNNLTQSNLARQLGVNQTAVGKYERGELEPNIRLLKKIADTFNCSVDYLVGREDDFSVIQSDRPQFDDAETELIRLFRSLPEIRKESVLDVVRGLASMKANKKS